MSLRRPPPDALTPQRSRKRSLAPSESPTKANKRVSFDKGNGLVRGPSPAYSGRKMGATEVIVNSSEDEMSQMTIEGLSPQISDEESDTSSCPGTTAGHCERPSGPITEAYEEQHPPSSFPFSQIGLWTKELTGSELEAQRDIEVCRRVHKLGAQIEDFAMIYTKLVKQSSPRPSVELLCSKISNAKLVRYIGYLAQGGANRLHSWRELLSDEECLTALVVGIVGMALKEHVFSALWFGGNSAQIKELEDLEDDQVDDDGYKRTLSRAERCRVFHQQDNSSYVPAAHAIAIALRKLLTPMLHMSDVRETETSCHGMPEEYSRELFEIVNDAAQLSRELRLCGNVIYHWSSTFKDEEFDPERMECLNTASMIRNSPYELKKQANGPDRSVLKAATEKVEAIVRVTAFPGLVAHRQGGGLLAKQLLADEKRKDKLSGIHLPPDVKRSRDMHAEKPLLGTEGFRTRVICKSIVHLQWGRQRLLTKEAGTSRHLDAMRDGGMAKYEEDRRGFVELFDHFLKVHPKFDCGSD